MDKTKHFLGRNITVYEATKSFTGNTSVQINWSALGSVSIKEAEKFAKELQKAILYAKKITK